MGMGIPMRIPMGMGMSTEVSLYNLPICRDNGFEVTYPIFEMSMSLLTRLPDVFHHLVPNDNFHCQMPLKTPNLTYLAVKMPVGKSHCE